MGCSSSSVGHYSKYPDDSSGYTYQTVNSDSSHILKRIYFNNTLVAERPALKKTGLTDGTYKIFYKNGKINVTAVYENGKMNGYYCLYNENGVLQEKLLYMDDSACGSQYRYYQSGQVKEYSLAIGEKRLAYIRYDSITGGLLKISGSFLQLNVLNYQAVYKINDTIQIYNNYFIPANTFVRISSYIVDHTGNFHKNLMKAGKDTYFKSCNSYVNFFDYVCKKNSNGDIYMSVLDLYDSTRKSLVYSDTSRFLINVK